MQRKYNRQSSSPTAQHHQSEEAEREEEESYEDKVLDYQRTNTGSADEESPEEKMKEAEKWKGVGNKHMAAQVRGNIFVSYNPDISRRCARLQLMMFFLDYLHLYHHSSVI